jgi:hypothetical protein
VKKKQPLASPWWLLPPGRLHPLWSLGIGSILLGIDYLTGLDKQMPALYVVPVSLAAWYSGRWPAVLLAAGLPLLHLWFLLTRWTTTGPVAWPVAMTIVRGAVILVMGLWFARLAEHERELHRHLRTLEGLLPICMFCKNIRNEAGEWERLEIFISKRSEARFSHGFCPSCGKEHYGAFVDADAPQPLDADRRNA